MDQSPAVGFEALSSFQPSPAVGACCLALSSLLGPKVSFPHTKPYIDSMNSYFSQQNAALRPLCVVSPTDADDVSTTIVSIAQASSLLSITDKSQCHFAIRSGGHTSLISEASNIQDGITIDLSGLNTIRLSDDQTTASVGVGATWGEVYSYLDSLNLSVAGGRAAQVGVGGLTLGGGISYHSPRYGWTCDTVSEFEIVLPNGTIVHATEEEHPDLTMALRGGSANFGIVTEVKLRAFKQGSVWGGHVYYPLETINDQLRAFESFNTARGYDDSNLLISDCTHRCGDRQLNVVITHGTTVDMLNATYLRWKSSLPEIEDVRGIVWSVSLEPLPPAIYARAPRKNALGLSNTTGSQVVTLLSATWEDETDDERIYNTARALFEGIEEDARRLNNYESFLYLNYAADWQDPIASYGESSIEMLKRVSRDVDPEGLFRKDRD
ncbi:hypothetical protein AN6876.2 [Aspergillus nidulans FGSC A4]|uniref:Oxidoreductase, FAD-binding, putative (AFU_orthologue AFUA_2G14470) n=1 Tax=Emericella nidulans (strain FGSC A4 / ATCC 38163 / CBS 112.46 / NRRL 194 / M139) TaxID=227321 RepID=Q5AXV4_EMENI|nr:hypothetical protein [Aspergillus nidulans FGSC A4]EAA58275.1 hypothetical protein AN6876.2 [Aspergillus nidulans FGSC A4]CBF71642.1 TPA: oxidoreductase, FAD-binding, putative (AFU_orthologue; AFUA_2G14470) [Aspergillus nidulans FGSC A4]|eukprot:XP_664480.1 hypothetical protein AN6876.2 [Aspergillus nidulans FGSC A4]